MNDVIFRQTACLHCIQLWVTVGGAYLVQKQYMCLLLFVDS